METPNLKYLNPKSSLITSFSFEIKIIYNRIDIKLAVGTLHGINIIITILVYLID